MKIFLLIQRLIQLFRLLIFPFSNYLFPSIFKFLRKRKDFESKNIVDICSQSFGNVGLKADIAFEVSSEGELEQALPYITKFIQRGRRVELIFASESVESACLFLAKENRDLLRVFRLPLLTYAPMVMPFGQSLKRWMTAERLVMCRYDFYPELLLAASECKVGAYLISATLINKKHILKRDISVTKLYWSTLFKIFDQIISPSSQDSKRFQDLGVSKEKLYHLESRVLRIERRLKKADETLASRTNLDEYLSVLKSFPKSKRVILAQAWPEEMEVFNDRRLLEAIENRNIHLTIAPHNLSNESIKRLFKFLTKSINSFGLETKVYVLRPQMSENDLKDFELQFRQRPGIIILTISGVLCELYSLFSHAHVGGGHGRSIHSVLEPYLAGSFVTCGPRVHRSTEFEFISQKSAEKIKIIKYLDKYYDTFDPSKPLMSIDFNSESSSTISSNFDSIMKSFGYV